MRQDVLKRIMQAVLSNRREEMGLTLAEVGKKLHCGSTYAKLESGSLPSPSEDLLQRVAQLYDLDRHKQKALWRATLGRDPEPLHGLDEDQIPGSWQLVADGQTHMAYSTNHQWRVTIHNREWPKMFPRDSVKAARCNVANCDLNHPDDVMRWMMTDLGAREVLTNWEIEWAPAVASAFRSALLVHRSDPYLAETERLVLADPLAGPIYEAFGEITVDLDGSIRPVNHGTYGPGWVTIHTSGPASCGRFQAMTIPFFKTRPDLLPPIRVPR
jgi:transcriptional regulator with XRE-family HTH domain